MISIFGLVVLPLSAAEIPPQASPGAMQPTDIREQTLPEQPVVTFPIPPAYERPFGEEEGDRVFVNRFVITGIVDDPARDVSAADVDALANQRFEDVMSIADAARRERQQLDVVDPNGFTEQERLRMSETMAEIVGTFDPAQQQQLMNNLIAELRFSKFSRDQGLTIGQIQTVADAVRAYFRERGFFLAQAIIPAQEVQDGVVEIRVLQGRLGRAIAEGNEMYSDEVITAPFADLEGEIVTESNILGPLLRAQDLPGLTISGVFQPGEEVGTADIILTSQAEKPVGWSFRADNHLSEFQGQYRYLTAFDWNNPTGNGDYINLAMLNSQRPSDTLFWDFRYGRPVFDPSWNFWIGANTNDFQVGGALASFEIGGVSETAQIGVQHSLTRSRLSNASLVLDLSVRRASIIQFGETTNLDRLSNWGFGYVWDDINTANRSLSSGMIRWEHGAPNLFNAYTSATALAAGIDPSVPSPSRSAVGDGATTFFASSRYDKVVFNYQRLKILDTPVGNQSFFFKVDGQWSLDLLTSLDQYSIGGPSNMRAIPSATFLADSGVTFSFEWTIRAPGFYDKPALRGLTWGQVFSITVFLDRTIGRTNFALANEIQDLDLTGAGIALGFDFGRFSMRWQLARLYQGNSISLPNASEPIFRQSSGETLVWFDLIYDHR
jgi:hemolysin activation/secretion protein